jgi:hypothetical protein
MYWKTDRLCAFVGFGDHVDYILLLDLDVYYYDLFIGMKMTVLYG